ncbi:DUF6542 domain-containing protein [Nocardioides sp. cx-173]|uniref:DUF6542 domain-containing protein n=1 Tax=Nocardioides sp. cx-173 TaxID=2898796 RepID=UPI001E4A7C69|nr:DUF6542 domain-containing protein [Nocardioides sp. cx-173]MCD4525568.1 hypothetical protein [Nocardioides sp. cx-173]UGB42712.1 hypothetical protein LQ940_04095 [Nocardioides sp. cx-173]
MTHARRLWEEGRQPGREVAALGAAASLTVAVLDLWLTDDVGLLFDLTFVALCVALALSVRPADFFTVGVMPPLLLVGVFVLVAVSRPGVLGHPEDGTVQAVITGMSQHSVALVVGYLLCLAVLFVRQRAVSAVPDTRRTPAR